jgi:hypothetical protein
VRSWTAQMKPQERRRLNDGLWQPIERPILLWLAARLPARLTPDNLTAIGLLGSIIVFFGYVLSSWHPGFFGSLL